MRLRKALVLAAATAALGSMSMFSSFAVEIVGVDGKPIVNEEEAAAEAETADTESMQLGWVEQGSNWVYYDGNGNVVTGWIKAENGDSRGNEVWYYSDPATGLMLANETRVIDGVSYTFNEDGSWLAPVPTAPKGKLNGGSFVNTWSNLSIAQVIGSAETGMEAEEHFSDEVYAEIGNPKLTHDLYMSSDFGDLEIYYANMKSKPEMDAAAFAAALGNAEKGKTGQVSAVENAVIANQNYSKVTVTRTNKKGKQSQNAFYCRKQEGFMVVIATSCMMSDAGAMADIVNSITTAQ